MTGPDDDRMDEMLIHGARAYNAPGRIPREEMWAAIAAARRQDRAAESVAPSALAPHRAGRPRWLLPGVGIAAALLLSTGIVIGRRMTQPSPDGRARSSVAPSAAAPTVATGSTSDTLIKQLREETHRTNEKARELAQAPTAVGETSQSSTVGADFQRGNTLALQLIVMRHLAGSEAMITSFRSTARRGERDPMMADWSREMLNTTRTLEASRVTDDPVMKRLLDDLDLVMSQIVQYATNGTHNPDELDLIEQSITRRGVISKLRSTLPARPMPTGL
jgi:hypothetical protein